MQIAALAILIIILFPVVSLTDDLLACTTPAEVEHLCGAIFSITSTTISRQLQL